MVYALSMTGYVTGLQTVETTQTKLNAVSILVIIATQKHKLVTDTVLQISELFIYKILSF